MRRNRWEISLGALVLAAALAGPAFAQEPRVEVNGREVDFRDQQPIERAGRVYIPLRGVLDRIGAETIEWRPDREEVYVASGGREIALQIGSHRARVNNRDVWLDAPPILVGGRTMVPLRFVSESLGASVEWDAASQTAHINSSQARVAGEREVYPPQRRNERPGRVGDRDEARVTAGPAIQPVHPLAGETVTAGRPQIVVRLRSAGAPIDLDAVRMRVNGRDVTPDLEIDGNQVTYRPPEPLEPGRVRVQMTVRDHDGNTATRQWSFIER